MSSYASADFRHVLNSFVQSSELSFREVLSEEQIARAAEADQVAFGAGRVWSVPVTLWAFIAQVVSDQKACTAAVARVLVYLRLLGRKVCHAGSGAYCKARAKLSESFLRRLACDSGQQLEGTVPDSWCFHGRRTHLIDGSTLSAPDTPELQAVYPQPRSQQPGVGFPILRVVAFIGYATGAVLTAAFAKYRGKETGETALFRSLLDTLRSGDVLVADRYYCNYWVVALALQRGVDVVFRKHQLRHTDFRTGRRLGRHDHLVTWTRPQRPKWMTKDQYRTMPRTLTLREVRLKIDDPACRVEDLVVVSTLLDPQQYPKQDLLNLYKDRWHVEIDLRSLKSYMKMDILRCKTPEMVHKEIWTHLLAYNLVRKVMAQAAQKHDLKPRQLSFAGTVQTLNEFRPLLLTATAEELVSLSADILRAVASHRVGNRPNRVEPRKVKRRPKGYSRMTKPRDQERAACQR